MSILSFSFVWKMVPDTKGKKLEEKEHLWNKNQTRIIKLIKS